MTRIIVTFLHFSLIIVSILIIISFFYLFSSILFNTYNPIYSFLVFELGINIDRSSFGIVGALVGFVIVTIILGPLFVLLEINSNIRKINSRIQNLERNIRN